MDERLGFPKLTDIGFEHDPPVVMLWNGLLTDVVKREYERLHVSPSSTGSWTFPVRVYKDGAWSDYFQIPSPMYAVFLQRLKVMAGMNLARMVPVEEGIIRVDQGDRAQIEIRVTTRVGSDGREEALLEFRRAAA